MTTRPAVAAGAASWRESLPLQLQTLERADRTDDTPCLFTTRDSNKSRGFEGPRKKRVRDQTFLAGLANELIIETLCLALVTERAH